MIVKYANDSNITSSLTLPTLKKWLYRLFSLRVVCTFWNYLERTALSVLPASSRLCAAAGTPDMNPPFFFAVGSVLLRILLMEKFVEPPTLFCVALVSLPSSSLVLITGKHLVTLYESGSGELFLLEDSGLDTTFTSMSLPGEPIFRATRCTVALYIIPHELERVLWMCLSEALTQKLRGTLRALEAMTEYLGV